MNYNFGYTHTKTGIFPRYNDDDGEMYLAAICCIEHPVKRSFDKKLTVMRCSGCGKEWCIETDEMSSFTERFNLANNPGISEVDIAGWAAVWLGIDREDVECTVTIR